MNKSTLKKLAVASATVAMVSLPMLALAQAAAPITTNDLGLNYATTIGLGTQDVRTTISAVIKAFMGLLGIVAVCIVLYGGFLYMTAGGNDDQAKKAKSWIVSGVIGLIIILSSYAIAKFVLDTIITGTTGRAPAP